jgi:hypothetical protein
MAAAAAAAGGEGDVGGGNSAGALLRIFVGGLAESVGAADLEALFASAGRVAGVEFVRTNGRSFAYVDFHCPNDKALARLFSTVPTPTTLFPFSIFRLLLCSDECAFSLSKQIRQVQQRIDRRRFCCLLLVCCSEAYGILCAVQWV